MILLCIESPVPTVSEMVYPGYITDVPAIVGTTGQQQLLLESTRCIGTDKRACRLGSD